MLAHLIPRINLYGIKYIFQFLPDWTPVIGQFKTCSPTRLKFILNSVLKNIVYLFLMLLPYKFMVKMFIFQ